MADADALVKPDGPMALAKAEGESPSALARLEVAQARARLSKSAQALKSDLGWLKLPLPPCTSESVTRIGTTTVFPAFVSTRSSMSSVGSNPLEAETTPAG